MEAKGDALNVVEGETKQISAVTCNVTCSLIQPLTLENLRASQSTDPVTIRLLVLKKNQSCQTQRDDLSEIIPVQLLLGVASPTGERQRDPLAGESLRDQMVIPESHKHGIYKHLHEEIGLLGADRTIAMARDCFFCPKMRQEMEQYITEMCRCLGRRNTTE